MKKVLKSFLNHTAKPLLETYLAKERSHRYNDISIRVLPGVFHPSFFFSTKVLLSYIENLNLTNKTFLELGAGTGLISIVAAKKGAIVTASDVSQKAMENISLNEQLNHVSIRQFKSDFFQHIPSGIFDYIVINPPYYKGQALTEAQQAWYAGEQLEYFKKLFHQLPAYMNEKMKALMILSEDCDLKGIQAIGEDHRFKFHVVYSKKVWWETNVIYELTNRLN